MSHKQDNATVNRHVVRRLLKYGKPYIGWFLLILLIIVGTVKLELWQPELIERASNEFVEKYIDISSDGFSIAELKNMRHDDLMGVLKLGGLYLISVVLMPLQAYSFPLYFTLRAGGKTVITTLFDCGSIWMLYLPISFFLSRFTGLPFLVIYALCNSADLVKCIVGSQLIRSGIWIQYLAEP